MTSKIGIFTTAFGTLDILVVSRKDPSSQLTFRSLMNKTLIEMMDDKNLKSCLFNKTAVKKTDTDVSLEVKGILLNNDLKILLRKLEEAFSKERLLIYVETFGNKYSTITSVDDYSGILSRVHSVFNRNATAGLIIDACISSSAGENTVTVSNNSFFKSLN